MYIDLPMKMKMIALDWLSIVINPGGSM
jgi:hypothetical protein